MKKIEIISRIERKKIVAIIREDNSDVAFRSAMACIAGGIECIEVALTTPFGLDVIEELSKLDGIVVGAGTVLDAETARLAIQMGAKFLLSPAVNPSMIRICSQYGVASVPGAFSPTEVVSALEAGADIVKIFPAGLLGPSYLESISSPLPQGLFMPSGGVTLESIPRWLNTKGVFALGIGGSLTSGAKSGDFDSITAKAAQFVQAVANATDENNNSATDSRNQMKLNGASNVARGA